MNVVEALDVFAHPKTSIAVITPYKAQKKLIEGRLNRLKGIKATWRVRTVDESQGTSNTRGSTHLISFKRGLLRWRSYEKGWVLWFQCVKDWFVLSRQDKPVFHTLEPENPTFLLISFAYLKFRE